jgi:hypothetical protein
MQKKIILLCTCLFIFQAAFCQENKVNIWLFDGFVVGGYVDNGAYLNFTGPNINFKKGKSKFVLGMLPSLRFKRDNATPRNATIFPSLGVGFTYSYKIWAFQLPLYYNAKTATTDGKWHLGFGVGLNITQFNKK